MTRTWVLSVLLLALCCSACNNGFCPDEVAPGLAVTIVDAISGEPRSELATAVATDGDYIETLGSHGIDGQYREVSKSGAYGRAGVYEVRVTASGYLEWTRSAILVREGRCTVRTAEIEARLILDSEPQVINGSFEINRSGSFYSWQVTNPVSVTLVDEGAPGAGSWSVQCVADQAPTSAIAFQKVSGLRNGDVVALQAMVKAFGEDGGGSIAIVVGNTPLVEPSGEFRNLADDWTRASLMDTLSLTATDSVWVRLSALPVEVALPVSGALFDSVVLTRISQDR